MLVLMAEGLSNKEIAYRLGLTTLSIKTMTSSLYRRMGVDNRFQAALWALRNPSLVPRRPPPYEFPIGI